MSPDAAGSERCPDLRGGFSVGHRRGVLALYRVLGLGLLVELGRLRERALRRGILPQPPAGTQSAVWQDLQKLGKAPSTVVTPQVITGVNNTSPVIPGVSLG